MFIVGFLSIISAAIVTSCLRPLIPDGVLVRNHIDNELFQAGDEMKLWCQDSDPSFFAAKCQENGTWSGNSTPICQRTFLPDVPVTTSFGQCQADCVPSMQDTDRLKILKLCYDSCDKPTTEWTLNLLHSHDVLGVMINQRGTVDSALSLEVSNSSAYVKCDLPAKYRSDYVHDMSVRCPMRNADRISIRFNESMTVIYVKVMVNTSRLPPLEPKLPGYAVGEKYIFVEKKLNYSEAKRTCEENDAELLGETTKVQKEFLKMRLESWVKTEADNLYVSSNSLRTARWIGRSGYFLNDTFTPPGASATSGTNAVAGINWARSYVNPEEEHYSICQMAKFNCTDYPGIPEAGRIIEHRKGSKVIYECFDGYTMKGQSTRTCNTKKGKYEPKIPTCVKRSR